MDKIANLPSCIAATLCRHPRRRLTLVQLTKLILPPRQAFRNGWKTEVPIELVLS